MRVVPINYRQGLAYGLAGVPARRYGMGDNANGQVNTGDQVKVTLQATSNWDWFGGSNAENASRAGNLLAATYAVINVDANAVGSLSGYALVLVQAVRPTTLAQVAADCNRALSASGFSVNQSPGGIVAGIYQYAAHTTPITQPGLDHTVYSTAPSGGEWVSSLFNGSGGSNAGGGGGGLFSGGALINGTTIPVTAAVVTGIVALTLIILLRK